MTDLDKLKQALMADKQFCEQCEGCTNRGIKGCKVYYCPSQACNNAIHPDGCFSFTEE